MKDATGELSMTAVAVVAIAAIAAIFGVFIWPQLRSSITQSTKCNNAVCNNCDDNTCQCTYITEDGVEEITCPNTNNGTR